MELDRPKFLNNLHACMSLLVLTNCKHIIRQPLVKDYNTTMKMKIELQKSMQEFDHLIP